MKSERLAERFWVGGVSRIANNAASLISVPLTKLVKTALEETRMLVLGAQVLLGFELSGVFREGFEDLPRHARDLDGAALVLMVITIALLITPESYHQIVDTGRDTGRFHQLISRLTACALLPFALSLGIVLFITGEHVFGSAVGLAMSAFFVVLAISCWYGLECWRRWQTGYKERALSARQPTMTERTPLDQRITQMLTEARVVLPGVQALLGFQLISVISQSFEKLPASSQLIHTASLGCIMIAVILLIAPAAYHRIVFSGQDTEEVHRIGSWFITAATVPLAFGLAGDVYVVLAQISASAFIGALIAGTALILLVGLWHALPLISRRQRRARPA
jgi:Family of unknown function (DUF6328)